MSRGAATKSLVELKQPSRCGCSIPGCLGIQSRAEWVGSACGERPRAWKGASTESPRRCGLCATTTRGTPAAASHVFVGTEGRADRRGLTRRDRRGATSRANGARRITLMAAVSIAGGWPRRSGARRDSWDSGRHLGWPRAEAQRRVRDRRARPTTSVGRVPTPSVGRAPTPSVGQVPTPSVGRVATEAGHGPSRAVVDTWDWRARSAGPSRSRVAGRAGAMWRSQLCGEAFGDPYYSATLRRV